MKKRIVSAVALGLIVAGCSQMAPPPAALNDGELAFPDGYKSWPVFLSAVQREDAKQIRDIYMNGEAARGSSSSGFPQGSVLVMENWAVKLDADGKPMKGADGKLVKDKLAAVFVMGKNPGWGAQVPAEQKNGNWIYTAFKGNGELNGDAKYNTCRGCHTPLKDKDFVFRYDEHFAMKK
ncbi:MAG: cytochrome P460 family protein [Gammaproteobacteria bacterium]|nr:cytochrome P460 family protein [Gammaproteobacteria bacterium]MBU0770720.1 cytochrome P460 family protein [Gammaproteobacteria bacterium]MBU0857594.1 cytochrome P460 family protein [Gammaproteobacteria bacterium]MBU1848662.1 cytochrome P460 family protein [Gammaproteobacteria bacterium]